MKKTLLTLAVAVATTFAVAAETVTFDFTENQYGNPLESGNSNNYLPDGTTFSEEAVTLSIQKYDYTNSKGDPAVGNGARFWDASGSVQFRVMSNSGITLTVDGGTITEVALVAAKGLNSFGAEGWTPGEENGDKAATYVGSNSSIVFRATGTVQLTSITVTYNGGVVDTRKDAELKFAEDKVEATLGEAFTAPALTKATTAEVTYSSDKEDVATVDATTGAVTLVGVGTARISAISAENEEFKAGSTSYLLTVKKAAPAGAVYFSEMGEDFTFENPEDLNVWQHTTTYGLKGSAYISNAINEATAYAVSPVITLPEAEASLTFDTAFNQYKLNNEMIAVADFAGKYAFIVIREEGATDWTELAEPTAPEAFNWNFYENAPISLADFAGKKVQLGFKYVSTADVAGTWEVKNISVSAQSGMTAVEAADNAPVEFFNLQGVRVANPENGLFIRRQGNKVSKVLVK